MSYSKRCFERRIEIRAWAEHKLIEDAAGVRCMHGNVINQRFDDDAIYEIALEAAKDAPDDLSRSEVIEAIQDAALNLDFECRFCGR
ncbi:hypothetical protein AB7813_14625 [Tardiphaga sp. 20_F10_N6_6]|uniref:hypothetical protein n=1 Tax=Tardiphaga sp. 20_F10_N6_6 TaxID=3240788 RepID=UPI003F89EA61